MFCPRCARVFGDGEKVCSFDGAELTANFGAFIRHQPTRTTGAILADRYKLYGSLDRGATARIFLAEDLVQKRPVVVKMMEAPHWHDERKRERFLREAEAAKIVDHPNVADTFFVGQRADGTPFIVMEFLFGESLGARLRREDRLDSTTVLHIAADVALGLEAAHGAGVFHRDVKPDNLFLVGQVGSHHSVKIIDFGFAKAGDTSITGGGIVIGTVEYMAPEQCLSDPIDGRTDLYGLGAVMYRAATGRLLVDPTEPMETRLARQVWVPPAPPRELEPEVSEALEAIVIRCLRKEPSARFASMAELDSSVRRALDGVPVTLPSLTEPDTYIPRTQLARSVAQMLRRRLGDGSEDEA